MQKNNKIKTLCCIHDFRGRGAEKVLSVILKYIDQTRFEVGLFTFNERCNYTIPDSICRFSLKEKASEVNVLKKILRTFNRFIFLTKIVREFKPDVIFAVAGMNELVIVQKLLSGGKVKAVLSEHAELSKLRTDHWESFHAKIRKFIIKWLYPSADVIIAPSLNVLNELYEQFGVPRKNMKVVRNPLEIELIRELSMISINHSDETKGDFKIGFVGALSREKNIQVLIHALAILNRTDGKYSLNIVGVGDLEIHLRDLVNSCRLEKKVTFLGFKNNPYCYINDFDVLVISSENEVLPYVIVEAMAIGVPVITSDWVGVDDVFSNEINCLVFKRGNESALAEAIKRLRMDSKLREQLVAGGNELIESFSATRVVKEYESLFAN